MISRRKTIIITGANRGIGLQAAKELAKQGHQVILTSRNKIKGHAAANTISPSVIYHQLDVTISESVKRFADFMAAEFEQIDVLINNAGSVFDMPDPDYQQSPLSSGVDILRTTLELNLIGAYAVTQALLPFMNKNQRSDIINISSGMGALTDMGIGSPTYRISKASLNAMTVLLANELAGTTIHANAVCPGWVKTDLGGAGAPRELAEGVVGINWIINQEPKISGKFIRDQEIIPF